MYISVAPTSTPAAFGFKQCNIGAPIFLLFFRFLDMALLLKHSTMRDGPDCAEQSTLLNGIDGHQRGAAVPIVFSTASGTMLRTCGYPSTSEPRPQRKKPSSLPPRTGRPVHGHSMLFGIVLRRR